MFISAWLSLALLAPANAVETSRPYSLPLAEMVDTECQSCVDRLARALSVIPGVAVVNADMDGGSVTLIPKVGHRIDVKLVERVAHAQRSRRSR